MAHLIFTANAFVASVVAQNITLGSVSTATQSTVVTILEPTRFMPGGNYFGAVVDACSGTTVLALACVPEEGKDILDNCYGSSTTVTNTVGPSVFVGYSVSVDNGEMFGGTVPNYTTATWTSSCLFNDTTAGTCAFTVHGNYETGYTATPSSVQASDLTTQLATITSGVEKLSTQSTCSKSGSSGNDSHKSSGRTDSDTGALAVASMGLCSVFTLLAALLL